MICIIIHLSLIQWYNKNTLNIDIFWQTNLSILIKKDYDFKAEVITHATKPILIFIDFVKHKEFF